MPARLRHLALFAFCGASAGCGAQPSDATDADTNDDSSDPASPCSPGGGEPKLEIGHGETAYLPLEPGGSLELIHGPQGGVHVLVALQAAYIDASDEVVASFRGYIDGEQLGASFPFLNMRCNEAEGGVQSWNTFLIWDAQPEDLHLQTVHIEVELTDASGLVLNASKEAVLHDPLLE